jgi:hypothetical protein
VRSKNGHNSHPNIIQVESALRTVSIDNLMASNRLLKKENTNCEADNDIGAVVVHELKSILAVINAIEDINKIDLFTFTCSYSKVFSQEALSEQNIQNSKW